MLALSNQLASGEKRNKVGPSDRVRNERSQNVNLGGEFEMKTVLANCGTIAVVWAALVGASAFAAGDQAGARSTFFAFDNGTGRGQLPPAEQAALLADLGYDGIGYTGCQGIPEMLSALDARKLKMFSTYVGAKVGPDGASYDPQLKAAIEQLARHQTLIWLYIQGGKPSSDEFDDQAVAMTREIADLAAERGLRVAFYPHVGFYVARVEDALRLVQKVERPNVGVSFNLCHFLKLDSEQHIESRLREAMPHLFMVSINGADAGDTNAMGWDRLIQTLDRGSFDVGSFLGQLRRLGYAGPVGLQCYALKGDIRENLQHSMVAWKNATGALGSAEQRPLLETPASTTPLHVAVELPSGLAQAAGALRLVNVNQAQEVVPAQRSVWDASESTATPSTLRLVATIPASPSARTFRIEVAPGAEASGRSAFTIRQDGDVALQVLEGDRPVLNYNFGVITHESVPENDPRRTRACYVHPVWGLDGEVLTDDFPKDHYHHHGIFWSWPHVQRDGQEYDLWVGRGIQHRFVRWLCRETGPVAAVLASENGWFIGEEKAVIERVCLRLYQADHDSQALDLEFEWVPVAKPLTLWGAEGKSYGGLTIRYAPRKETVITVPEGRTTEDLLETRLRWADFSGIFAERAEPSGAAVFIHPRHPDFPPTWLTRHYGCLCVGWPGVVSRTFQPGESIRTAYRVLIHRGLPEAAALEQDYSAYQSAADVQWK